MGLKIYNLLHASVPSLLPARSLDVISILLSCPFKLRNSIFFLHFLKDAIDLMQGHYIMSVSRDMTASSQKGGIEAIAVSAIAYSYCIKFLLFLFIKFHRVAVSLE